MKTLARPRAAAGLLAGSLALALASACSQPTNPPAANANKAAPPATNQSAPAPVEKAKNEPDGKALFEANCAVCHLETGKGDPAKKKQGIPNFTDAAFHKRMTDEKIRSTIENGEGGGKVMPPFKGVLEPEEISAIIAYVRGFPERAGSAPAAPKTENTNK